MSIFDNPRAQLNPKIWNGQSPNPHVHSQVSEHLKQLLKRVYPEEKIFSLTLIGSNVGYQYSDTSDIDVQVMGIPGETFDTWHKIFKDFNNTPNLFPNSEHTINFFWQEFRPAIPDWENSLGAYDLIRNTWLKKPIPPQILMHIAKTKQTVIQYAEMYIKMIRDEIEAVAAARDRDDHSRLRYHLSNLYRLFKQLDVDRKTSYSIGTGSKSLQDPNVIFKFVEHDPVIHNLFKQMIELPETTFDSLEKEAKQQNPNYFIYARVPDETKQQLPKISIPKENFHVTLKYLGPKSPEELEIIKNTLNRVLEDKRDIPVSIEEYATFPNSSIYHAKTNTSARLKELKHELNRTLGPDTIHRKFRPHVTLSYSADKIKATGSPKPDINDFNLSEIILARASSRYEPYAQIAKHILPERNIFQKTYDWFRD